MFSTGIFPDSLKTAKIIPIHKKNDFKVANNYRPIAILPVLSKIVEKILHEQLNRFLRYHSLLSKQQHEFVRKGGTLTAAYHLSHEILTRLEGGKEVVGLFFDFTKAFDIFNHDILLAMLETFGIRGLPLQLITLYLKGRRQLIELEVRGQKVSSNLESCRPFSVPQGSILGPLLFIIYMNDLPSVKVDNEGIILYADDTSAIMSCDNSNLISKAESVACKIGSWLDGNGLQLNAEKTEVGSYV